MADRGERQRLVFGLIHRMGWVTSRDVADAFGISQGGAATELNRYRVQGFLRREVEPGRGPGPPIFRYTLGQMGLTKANWWIKQAELLHPPGQGHLPGMEPVEPEPRVIRPRIQRVVRPDIRRGG